VIKGLRHSTECVNAVVNTVFHKHNQNYAPSCFGINNKNIANMITVSNTQPNPSIVHQRYSPRLTIQYNSTVE
jgi:hypothetical protein